MADRQHNSAVSTDLHTLIRWTVANSTARLALVVTSVDVGKLCLQTDTGACYILTDESPMTWLGILILNTDGTGTTWLTNTQVVGAQAIYNFVFQYTTAYTPHTAVDCATTTVLPAGTYANGTAGVGATFTVTATGTLTIDGHLTILGDRVLVKNQAAGLQNGIYTVTTSGAVGVSAVLTRATDADTSAELLNSVYAVLSGTVNAPAGVSTFWYVANTAAITIGTDTITFTQIATPSQGGGPPGQQFTAPLKKQGNSVTLAIDDATAYTTPVDADEIVVAKASASFGPFKVLLSNLWTNYIKSKADALYAALTGANFTGTVNLAKGAAVAAANNLVLGADGNVFHITGATQINLLASTNFQAGSTVTLIFDSTPLVKHNTAVSGANKPILLVGGVDWTPAANDVLTLTYDGTSWYDSRIGALNALGIVPINAQSGTTYTFALVDRGALVTGSNGAATTFTIPANSSVPFPVGTVLNIAQIGDGQITVAITSDTLNGKNGLKCSGKYAMVSATKLTSTTWILTGDASA